MLYSDSLITVELHESSVPWLKIFTQTPRKEFSECTAEEKQAIWDTLDLIEKTMLDYFHPDKINIASFGNMLPRVHWHVMARFRNDDYFPEPMWGVKQREGFVLPAPMEPFLKALEEKLSSRKAER